MQIPAQMGWWDLGFFGFEIVSLAASLSFSLLMFVYKLNSACI